MRLKDIEGAVEVVVADGQPHACLFVPVLVHRHATKQSFFGKRAVTVIHEEKTRRRVTGDIDVGPAVVVEVGGDGRHGKRAAGLINPRLDADIAESSVTVVVIQRAAAGRQPPGSANHRHSVPKAVFVVAGLGRLLQIEINVISHEQVQVPVAIVVDPGAAGAPAALLVEEAGPLGDVAEGAVAVVVVEHVLSPIRDEDVVEAVVVVVADSDGRGPSGPPQARFVGHVGERTVAIVFVEAVGGLLGICIEPGTREEQNIQPAVVVVVQKRTAATRRLENVGALLGIAVNRRLGEACLAGDIGETRMEGQAGGFGAPLRTHVAGRRPLGRQRRGEQSQQAAASELHPRAAPSRPS